MSLIHAFGAFGGGAISSGVFLNERGVIALLFGLKKSMDCTVFEGPEPDLGGGPPRSPSGPSNAIQSIDLLSPKRRAMTPRSLRNISAFSPT